MLEPMPPLPPARREELNQPVFAAIDAFEYPELHDESIPALNFLRHLGKLMASTGVKDFGLKVRRRQQRRRQQRRRQAAAGRR